MSSCISPGIITSSTHNTCNKTSNAQLRKIKKPLIERRRRERINECLIQLKTLVLEAMNKDESRYSKMEKADILEMTVTHLKSLQKKMISQSMVQTTVMPPKPESHPTAQHIKSNPLYRTEANQYSLELLNKYLAPSGYQKFLDENLNTSPTRSSPSNQTVITQSQNSDLSPLVNVTLRQQPVQINNDNTTHYSGNCLSKFESPATSKNTNCRSEFSNGVVNSSNLNFNSVSQVQSLLVVNPQLNASAMDVACSVSSTTDAIFYQRNGDGISFIISPKSFKKLPADIRSAQDSLQDVVYYTTNVTEKHLQKHCNNALNTFKNDVWRPW